MLKKPYIFIGTLLTAGAIIGVGYNIINASNVTKKSALVEENQTMYIQNYSKGIENLGVRLAEAEKNIDMLEEKTDSLKEDNRSKNNKTSNLQAKANQMVSTSTIEKEIEDTKEKVDNIIEKEDSKKNKLNELIAKKEKLQKEIEELKSKNESSTANENKKQKKLEDLEKKKNELREKAQKAHGTLTETEIEQIKNEQKQIEEEIIEIKESINKDEEEIATRLTEMAVKNKQIDQIIIDIATMN